MAFEWVDPQVWLTASGGGGGLLGFIAGQVRSRGRRIAALEREVQECRKRDARFYVVEAGFRMVVGEMQRKDPDSEVLKQTGDLLRQAFGELSPAPTEFEDILKQIKREEDDEADHAHR